ncbi:MAG: hypothetical protein V1837_06840 [Candidatus Woesearchaeota archaeon]
MAKTTSEQVIAEVELCWETFAHFLKAKSARKPNIEVHIPQILPSYESSYIDFKGNICITERDFGEGRVYGEEVAHSLRESLRPYNFRRYLPLAIIKEYKDNLWDSDVDEFFGRLGQTICEILLKDTIHNHLFKGPEPTYSKPVHNQGSKDLPLTLRLQSSMLESRIQSNILGYIAAETFMRENPGFMTYSKDLFRKTDRYIRRNFIEKLAIE